MRCRSSAIGAEWCTSWSTCCWHEWLECRRVRGKSFPSSCAIKAHIQNEEGVGGEREEAVFCHWGYRCSWQTESFLLSGLSKGCLVVDARPSWDLATLSGVKHFARDKWLRLETPGWRVLDFEGNPLSESELERRKQQILRGPLVVRDCECPFAEDLIVDESGALDATLPVVAKVSSLIEVLSLGGPFELLCQLWSQFTLIASRVNIDVASSRDEVLVGIVLHLVATCTCSLAYWCCVSVDHLEWNVPPHSCSCLVGWKVMGSAASSLKNAVQRSGSWCGHGRGPHFDVFALPCWAGLVRI